MGVGYFFERLEWVFCRRIRMFFPKGAMLLSSKVMGFSRRFRTVTLLFSKG